MTSHLYQRPHAVARRFITPSHVALARIHEDGIGSLGGGNVPRLGNDAQTDKFVGSRLITTDGFALHDEIGRMILTGSINAWVIDSRYACNAPYRCLGRDFVPESLWRRLEVATGTWKPGDGCVAVFTPERPNIATFRPRPTLG